VLRFIVGRSGSGKTEQCLREIIKELENNPEANCIYLVPEQGSFYAEKSLLKYSKRSGIMRAQVLSFRRLAWRVLQETGGGTLTPLDEIGRILILKHLLTKHQEQFEVFAPVLSKSGFLEQLNRDLLEMKNYCLSVEELEECLGELSGDLKQRLAEFVFIYREFEKYTAEKYLDVNEPLELLAARLYQADFIKNTQIWIDGFHGFTPLEFAVLRELLQYCPQVNLTLCLEPKYLQKWLPTTHLFFKPWETYQYLLKIAAEIQCPLAESVILPIPGQRRFKNCEELAFLERSFLETMPVFKGKAEALKIQASAKRQEEVEQAAREIVFLCREKGLHYRDIAILVRDFSNYENLLIHVLREYGIPFFLDKKKAMNNHPLPNLIQSVLEAIINEWDYDSLFRSLKTDLWPITRSESDLLENYCLQQGIKGRQWWLRKFEEKKNEETDAQVLQAGSTVVKLLTFLQAKLLEAKTAREYCQALFVFLVEMGVPQKLEKWSLQAEAEGQLEEARIQLQVWQKILELLDHLVEILGDEPLDLQEFTQLMISGMETLELALIPPGLDQVLIGSVERSRHPDLKAVLILGINEGVFPAKITESSIFNDQDRQDLAERELVLAPSTEQKLFDEQFLFYRALTTPSEYLVLSYALADEEGRALGPSPFLQCLQLLFPDKQFKEQESALQLITLPKPTFSHLVINLRQAKDGQEIDPLWWEVYNWYLKEEKSRTFLTKMIEGLFYKARQADLAVKSRLKLYGKELQVSVSRLEIFQACPFQHFLTYGLRLKEQNEYLVSALDLGHFFHRGLEEFYYYLKTHDLEHGELSAAELKEIVDKIVVELAPVMQNKIFYSTARYRYLINKLARILLRAVIVLGEHHCRSNFRPWGVEISFGKQASWSGLHLQIGGTKVEVVGRIDRIDLAENDGNVYVRVIDYKSGELGLNLEEIYYGLKLQLPIYLLVALQEISQKLKRVTEPAGMFYFPVKDPLINTRGPLDKQNLEQEILKNLKLRGYLLENLPVVKLMDQEISGYSELLPVAINKKGEFYRNQKNVLNEKAWKALISYAESLVKKISKEILSGKIGVQPYYYRGHKPCNYCPYPAVCGFDPLLPGYSYRYLWSKTTAEIWSQISLETGEENE